MSRLYDVEPYELRLDGQMVLHFAGYISVRTGRFCIEKLFCAASAYHGQTVYSGVHIPGYADTGIELLFGKSRKLAECHILWQCSYAAQTFRRKLFHIFKAEYAGKAVVHSTIGCVEVGVGGKEAYAVAKKDIRRGGFGMTASRCRST